MGLFDEFLSLAQEGKKKEDEDRAAAAAATTYQAADRKPDMEASLRKLAGATGESPDALRDPATQASAKRAAAANEAAAAPPGTQAWLSDPQNAAIGHDDIASLSKVESALRYISNPPAFGPAYSTTGIATPGDKAKADRVRAFFSSASQIPEAIGGGIAAAPSVVSGGLASAGEMFWPKSFFRDTLDMPDLADAAEYATDYWKKTAKAQKPKVEEGGIADYAGKIAETGTVSALSGVFGMAGTGAGLGMFALSADGGYRDYVKAGVHPVIAAGLDISGRTMEALTELPGMKILQGGKTAGIKGKVLKWAGAELAGEEVSTLWDIGAQLATTRPDLSWSEIFDQLVETAIITAGMGPFHAAVMSPVAKTARMIEDYQKATDARRFFIALGEGAGESKVRQRLPDAFQAQVQEIIKDGKITEVGVPVAAWDQFFQKDGGDPQKAAEEILGPELLERYQNAKETGGDVVVPLDRFATQVATEKNFSDLVNDIRLRPDDLTVNEAKAAIEAGPKTVEDLAKMAQEEIENMGLSGEMDAESKKIYDEALYQLEEIFPEDIARQNAMMTVAFNSLASRTGGKVTPYQLWERHGKIPVSYDPRSPEERAAAQQTQMERQEAEAFSATPEFKTWFGDSTVRDESGMPMVMYHGTAALEDFDQFSPRRGEFGVHLGTLHQANQIAGARTGGRMIPVFVSIKNPVRLVDKGEWGAYSVTDQLMAAGILTDKEAGEAYRLARISPNYRNAWAYLRKTLQAKGYDGVVYMNRREGYGTDMFAISEPASEWGDRVLSDNLTDQEFKAKFPQAKDSYIAFAPEQIKSVFNRGKWSVEDPSLLNQTPIGDMEIGRLPTWPDEFLGFRYDGMFQGIAAQYTEIGKPPGESITFYVKPEQDLYETYAKKMAAFGREALPPPEGYQSTQVMKQMDEVKWEYPAESTIFGTVNNRLSKELEVVERLIGPIEAAVNLPGKGAGKNQEVVRSIRAMDLGAALFAARDNGTLARLVDHNVDPKLLADERGLKGKERKDFIAEVRDLRSGSLYYEIDEKGKPILSDNGKATASVDLLLATCQPTTPCQECYAAASMIRMSAVRKALRSTIHMIMDPKGFGERVAKEIREYRKDEMPFARLLGSGDLTSEEGIIAFNTIAENADRPIHIFSRHHDNLRQLKGTAEAPFLKMGSVDAQLFSHYGIKFLRENMKEHGIVNAFLNIAPEDLESMMVLQREESLGLILSAGKKLHDALPTELRLKSCPCDADERSYLGSCRQCALNMGGCFALYAAMGIDESGAVWHINDKAAPKNLTPMLKFSAGYIPKGAGNYEARALGKVASDIIRKSVELIDLNRRKYEKGETTSVTIKDLRWPQDTTTLVDIDKYLERANAKRKKEGKPLLKRSDLKDTDTRLYMSGADLMNALANERERMLNVAATARNGGTFYLPGGEIQGPVAYSDWKRVDATLVSKAEAKSGEIRMAPGRKLKQEDYQEAYNDLAYLQRGIPEQAMTNVQWLVSGDLWQDLMDVGDLMHRMNEEPTWHNAGWVAMNEKIDRLLRHMKWVFQYEKDIEATIRSNAEYRIEEKKTTLSVEEQRERIFRRMEEFSKAHANLPTYNAAHYWVQRAAVEYGMRRFYNAKEAIEKIKEHMTSPEEWKAWAHSPPDEKYSKSQTLKQADKVVFPETVTVGDMVYKVTVFDTFDAYRKEVRLRQGKQEGRYDYSLALTDMIRKEILIPSPAILKKMGKNALYILEHEKAHLKVAGMGDDAYELGVAILASARAGDTDMVTRQTINYYRDVQKLIDQGYPMNEASLEEEILAEEIAQQEMAVNAAMARKGQVLKQEDTIRFVMNKADVKAGYVQVDVDVDRFLADWERTDSYVGIDGRGAISNRLDQFRNWMEKGLPVEMATVGLRFNGEPAFANGRHRFIVLAKEYGMKVIPVAVSKDEATEFAAKYGVRQTLSQADIKDAFRSWFGASQVVDAEGNPREVYHGTTATDIFSFGGNESELSALGWTYFSANPAFAEKFAFSDQPLPIARPLGEKVKVTLLLRPEEGKTEPRSLEVEGNLTDIPGLAITPAVDGGHSITHMQSGYAIAHGEVEDLLNAIENLKRLRINWTKGVEDFKKFSKLTNQKISTAIREGLRKRNDDRVAAEFGYKRGAVGFGRGSNVMPVYLKIEKPLDLRGLPAKSVHPNRVAYYIENILGVPIDRKSMFFGMRDLYQMLNDPAFAREIRTKAMSKGFDGIIFNDYYDPVTRGESFITFTPDQVKSKFNAGTWGPGGQILKQAAAFHGTGREDIKKFQTRFIGTGEGAAAFGWGLYFASAKEVAEWYRATQAGDAIIENMSLGGKKIFQGGLVLDYTPKTADDYENMRAQLIEDILVSGISLSAAFAHGGREGVREYALEVIDRQIGYLKEDTSDIGQRMVLAAEKFRKEVADPRGGVRVQGQAKGRIYKVNLKPKDSEFLDLDKRILGQSKEVIGILTTQGFDTQSKKGWAVTATDDENVFHVVDENDKIKATFNDSLEAQNWIDSEYTKAEVDDVQDSLLAQFIKDNAHTLPGMLPPPPTPQNAGKKWDKKKEESRKVVELLREMNRGEFDGFPRSGMDFYNWLSRKIGSPEGASKFLHSIGIPGNIYLDATSRGEGQERRHNYVVFHEDEVQILKQHFFSGLGKIGHFTGGVWSGGGVGISLYRGEYSRNLVSKVGPATKSNDVFVDSGAFTAFRKQKPYTEADWERVFKVYDQLVAEASDPSRLYIVAPDVIGNEDETSALQIQHLERMKSWADKGVHLIVPIQRGWEPERYDEHLAKVREALGDAFIIGVASNEEAWPPEQAAEVLKEIGAKRIHLLGIGPGNPRFKELIKTITDANPGIQINTDAVPTGMIGGGMGKPIEALKAGAEEGWRIYDDTELFDDALAALSDEGLKELWTQYNGDGYFPITAEEFAADAKSRTVGEGDKYDFLMTQPYSYEFDRLLRKLVTEEVRSEGKSGWFRAVATKGLVEKLMAKYGIPATVREGGPVERGEIEISPDKKMKITLLKDMNLSTYLHENSHAWLEVIRGMIERGEADRQLQEDWKVISAYLGIEGVPRMIPTEAHEKWARTAELYFMEGQAPSSELVGAFARFREWLIEIYRSVDRFARTHNVSMNDELRGVFSRILATDQQIERAKGKAGMTEIILTAEKAGMSEAQFALYTKTVREAHDEAAQRIEAKLLAQLARERKAWWKEESAQVAAKIEEEARKAPVYQVLRMLRTGMDWDGNKAEGQSRMDRQVLVDLYGEEYVRQNLKGLYVRDGGQDPAVVATAYGYDSVDAMVQDIVKTPSLSKFVKAETERVMKERHGSMEVVPGAVTDAALDAVHNESQAKILAMELRALRKLAKTAKPFQKFSEEILKKKEQLAADQAELAQRERDYERQYLAAEANLTLDIELGKAKAEAARKIDALKKKIALARAEERARDAAERREMLASIPNQAAFREAAQRQVNATPSVEFAEDPEGRLQVRRMAPGRFLAAERQAGTKAFEAAARGDYEVAAAWKQRQMLNHFLYVESRKAQERVQKIYRYMTRLQEKPAQARLAKAGGDFQAIINTILDQYEFANLSGERLMERADIVRSLDLMQQEGIPITLPDAVVNDSKKVNYKTLTYAQIVQIYEAVRTLDKTASEMNKVKDRAEAVDFEEATNLLANSAFDENDRLVRPFDKNLQTTAQDMGDRLRSIIAEIDKAEQIFEWLDGKDINGPWSRYIWRPIADAYAAEEDLTKQYTAKFISLWEAYLEGTGPDRLRKKIDIEWIPGERGVTLLTLIPMALNVGNESNKMKLMEGYGISEERLTQILSVLEERDWQFVQAVWDAMEEIYPLAEDMHKRITGETPERIPAVPFTVQTADGKTVTLRGGYYPVVYDPAPRIEATTEAAQRQADAASLGGIMDRNYVHAYTPHGYTQKRTGYAAPILLDLQVIPRHFAGVIHDITHREAIIQANRLLKNAKVQDAIRKTMGDAYVKNLQAWLAHVANAMNTYQSPASQFDAIIDKARTNASIAIMGFKAATAIAQTLDMLQAARRIKVKFLAPAIQQFLRHPWQSYKWVREKSGEMRHREHNLDRDLREVFIRNMGKEDIRSRLQNMSMKPLEIMDTLAAYPAWIGAYNQAITSKARGGEGLEEKDAIAWADRQVRLSQPTGAAKDLAAVQRKGSVVKALTMFYSYFSVLFSQTHDIVHEVGKARREGRNWGGDLAWGILMLHVIPAIMSDLLAGRGPDDDESWLGWSIARVLSSPLNTIPFARDVEGVVEAAVYAVTGDKKKFRPPSQTPIAGAITSAAKVVEDIAAGEEKKAVMHVLPVVGTVFGLPTGQVGITGRYLWDLADGSETPENSAEMARNLLFKKPANK